MSGYRLEELATGVYARIGSRPLDPNSGIIVGDEGIVLIDSSFSPAAARDIQTDIARLTPKPVATVIISHHHWDHCWGNQVFEGARIVGHENARAALANDPPAQVQSVRNFAHMYAPWFDLTPDAFNDQLDELRLTPPTTTYTDAITMHVGGHEVRLLHPGPGHTYGDTLVYLPAERVLFGGDVVCNHLIPVVGDGDPFNFGKVLDDIASWDVGAIVPGHGRLSDKRDLHDFAACLHTLCDEVAAARRAGAPDPRAAFELVSRNAFSGWHGREMLPGSVRKIFRTLEAMESQGQ